ncbi:MAG: Lrp/AsnC family transcriptional regulator [Armatimonadota bacterium]
MKPDEFTIDILKILEKDSRTTLSQIAAMTGKSEDEVQKAVASLEGQGIIRRYKTVIDWQKTGLECVNAYIDVKVAPSRGVGFDDVAGRIARFPEVHSIYLVSGELDLRIIVTGKTILDVAHFVSEKLSTIDRVQSTITHFVLKCYKEDSVIFGEPSDDKRLPVVP